MTQKHLDQTMHRAAQAGKGAMDGIKDVHGHAQLVSRLPRIGRPLAMLIYAGGALKGAALTLGQKR